MTLTSVPERQPLNFTARLDTPPVSHCTPCGRMVWLHDLEIYSPRPRVLRLRCRSGCVLAAGQRFAEAATRLGEVTLIEDPDGRVRLEETVRSGRFGLGWLTGRGRK